MICWIRNYSNRLNAPTLRVSEFECHLQEDGSLVLECSFTLGDPTGGGGLQRKTIQLRDSGENTDFRIRSPGGKEFKVS